MSAHSTAHSTQNTVHKGWDGYTLPRILPNLSSIIVANFFATSLYSEPSFEGVMVSLMGLMVDVMGVMGISVGQGGGLEMHSVHSIHSVHSVMV